MNESTETPSIPATIFALLLMLTLDAIVKSSLMLKAICLNLVLA